MVVALVLVVVGVAVVVGVGVDVSGFNLPGRPLPIVLGTRSAIKVDERKCVFFGGGGNGGGKRSDQGEEENKKEGEEPGRRRRAVCDRFELFAADEFSSCCERYLPKKESSFPSLAR